SSTLAASAGVAAFAADLVAAFAADLVAAFAADLLATFATDLPAAFALMPVDTVWFAAGRAGLAVARGLVRFRAGACLLGLALRGPAMFGSTSQQGKPFGANPADAPITDAPITDAPTADAPITADQRTPAAPSFLPQSDARAWRPRARHRGRSRSRSRRSGR